MPQWMAWYTGGRVFRGLAVDEWKALPPVGLLWVTVWNAPGERTFFDGGDWYWWDADRQRFRYLPSGEWGTEQPCPDVSCLSCLKRGAGVSDEEFEFVRRDALKERLWRSRH